jgi:uncharacterized protein involved in exopolysaccharide biosynthesis
MKNPYKNEAEVVALIDKYLKAIVDNNQQIINKDILCAHLRGTVEADRIAGIRDQIATLTREVAWREGRLETLKEILAEFRTLELPLQARATIDP